MRTDRLEWHDVAQDIRGQLSPHNAMRDVRELLRKVERDKTLRYYVKDRFPAVAALACVFVFVSTVCAIAVMFFMSRLMPYPLPFWYRGAILLIVFPLWAGGIAAQLYVFAVWMEEIAARNKISDKTLRARPRGIFAYLKYSRTVLPWTLIAICVVAPLIVLIGAAPLVALIVVPVAALAPVIFLKTGGK